MVTKVGKKEDAGKCFPKKLVRIPKKVFAFAIKVSEAGLFLGWDSDNAAVGNVEARLRGVVDPAALEVEERLAFCWCRYDGCVDGSQCSVEQGLHGGAVYGVVELHGIDKPVMIVVLLVCDTVGAVMVSGCRMVGAVVVSV